MLRESKGNMYQWVTHTWNPIKGKCSHDCSYCYMKRFKLKDTRLEKKVLETDLGEHKVIFVGSSTDMFAHGVPDEWIASVLRQCCEYSKNQYFFQTKNPARFYEFRGWFEWMKNRVILGTTIESNYIPPEISKAPPPATRALEMYSLAAKAYRTMVSIEPVMEFNLYYIIQLIKMCQPLFVSIGADSKGHKLPEPTKHDVIDMIEQLNEFTDVLLKNNLRRIIGNACSDYQPQGLPLWGEK